MRYETFVRLRVASWLAVAALVAGLLAGCSPVKDVPQPRVEPVPVQVAVPVPCPALTALGPEPEYPDTDEAIARATSIGALAKLYAAGRKLRVQRLVEYAVASAACTFQIPGL